MPTPGILKHVYSPQHRAAVIDNGIATSISDPFGTVISLHLSRMDVRSISEPVAEVAGGGFSVLGGAVVETETQRLIEFTALLRPDQAKTLVVLIQNSLRVLPPDQRTKFGITDADIAPVVQPL